MQGHERPSRHTLPEQSSPSPFHLQRCPLPLGCVTATSSARLQTTHIRGNICWSIIEIDDTGNAAAATAIARERLGESTTVHTSYSRSAVDNIEIKYHQSKERCVLSATRNTIESTIIALGRLFTADNQPAARFSYYHVCSCRELRFGKLKKRWHC